MHAQKGDVIGLAGPGGPARFNPEADYFIFIGDLSALPMIAASLEQLRADAPGAALHRRRDRAEQFDAGEIQFAQQMFGLAAGFIEKALGLPRLVGFGAQQGKVCEGWQAGCTTLAQGLLGKGEAVVYTCDCTEEYVRINM